MHTTCVNSKDNAKSNDSDYSFVIRENMRLKHRCPSSFNIIDKQHQENVEIILLIDFIYCSPTQTCHS